MSRNVLLLLLLLYWPKQNIYESKQKVKTKLNKYLLKKNSVAKVTRNTYGNTITIATVVQKKIFHNSVILSIYLFCKTRNRHHNIVGFCMVSEIENWLVFIPSPKIWWHENVFARTRALQHKCEETQRKSEKERKRLEILAWFSYILSLPFDEWETKISIVAAAAATTTTTTTTTHKRHKTSSFT